MHVKKTRRAGKKQLGCPNALATAGTPIKLRLLSSSGFFAMTRYESSLGYPDEHMRLLGLIAAHWESFEVVLERTLTDVMTLEHGRVNLLTANMSFAAKLDLITIYARDAFVINRSEPKLWELYSKIVKRLQAAYTIRNKYVHGKWYVEKKTNEFMRNDVRTRGGKLVTTQEATTIEQMADAVQEITAAGEEFVWFFLQLGIGPRLQQSKPS